MVYSTFSCTYAMAGGWYIIPFVLRWNTTLRSYQTQEAVCVCKHNNRFIISKIIMVATVITPWQEGSGI